MYFNHESGIQVADKEKVNINRREAIRAVILKDDCILMVHNNKGDYKFPGGGANKDENHEQTLKREVEEETGYIIDSVIDKIGIYTERKLDDYDKSSIFEMISHYYQCKISEYKTSQKLDDYEFELDFKPVWITLDEAIQINSEILKKDMDKNSWVHRETFVLKALKEYYSSLKYKTSGV